MTNGWPEDWAVDESLIGAAAKQLAAYPPKPKCPEALSEADKIALDLSQKIDLLMRAVLDVKSGISHMKHEMDVVNLQFDKLYAKTIGTSFQFERMRAEIDKLKEEVHKLQCGLGKTSTDNIVAMFSREK